MTNERANPFDVGEFAPKPGAAKPVKPGEIDELAAVTGFISRSPKAPPAPAAMPTPTPSPGPQLEHTPVRGAQRRRRTGRNHQVNIRATAETLDLLAAIADELDEPFGAVLEKALLALRRDMDKRPKSS